MQAILDFENRPWSSEARKQAAMVTELGLSPARYYQRLFTIVEMPEVVSAEPMLVKRVRGRLQRRADARARRKF